MDSVANPNPVFFPLRSDVDVLPGPAAPDGSPTALVHDRFHETFDRCGWVEREVLRRLDRPVTLDILHAALERETTIRVGKDELLHFVTGLERRGLLRPTGFPGTAALVAETQRRRRHPAAWLLTHYLFFKVPLFRPDAFLRRTLWLPRLLGSRAAGWLYLAAAALAIVLFLPRSGVFLQSAAPFIALGGAFKLAVALVVIKACHEFSHAYAAAVRGVRVRSMGIAFMVMTPVPYCDVTDAWRLDRRRRLAISFAGVRTELVLAAFALLGWCLAPPGAVRDILLFLCSAGVVSTLLTNLNPGVRFDGYYLLSDLIGVDNLQATAVGEARAFFHGIALGFPAAGNPDFSRRKRALLVVYAMYACLYRLALYFGIALLVYHYFPKVLGIALFVVEIFVFIAAPFMREGAGVLRMIRKNGINPRLLAAAAVLLAVAGWLVLPLPRRLALEAIVIPGAETRLFAPDSGMVTATALERGGIAAAGAELLALSNTRLDADIRHTALELESAESLVDYALSTDEGRVRMRDRLGEAGRLRSYIAAQNARRDRLRLLAPAESRMLEVNETLRPGTHVAAGTFIARLLPLDATPLAAAYIPEARLEDVRTGSAGVFVPASDPGLRIPVEITAVRRTGSEYIEEPALLESRGGSIPVMPGSRNGLTPADALYRLEARFDGDAAALRLGQSGTLYTTGKPRSLAWDAVRRVQRILLRESGF